ncbi:hypothetical protein KOW79_000058 [Hemibagrus wyckioides]|uniref:Uncharacterized protein n=1 Tax=Hemibagrus wyckioides TaxID=337641 RepID=A0A9D3N2K4_9TELE|nr:hypothetical protein KOW79_000058 [Hemibagrus wyckioides]
MNFIHLHLESRPSRSPGQNHRPMVIQHLEDRPSGSPGQNHRPLDIDESSSGGLTIRQIHLLSSLTFRQYRDAFRGPELTLQDDFPDSKFSQEWNLCVSVRHTASRT